ncbi:hypothetical protein MJH12_07540 [bacterium]|nr:hypothetical protein [bacterium]
MKISFFKTYKTNYKNNDTSSKTQEFAFQIPKALTHSKKSNSSDQLKVAFSSKLIKILDEKRSKLKRKSSSNNHRIQNRLQALLGQNDALKSSKINKTLDKIPLKRSSSEDTKMIIEQDLNILKYMSNHKDPYGKIRNHNNISIIK